MPVPVRSAAALVLIVSVLVLSGCNLEATTPTGRASDEASAGARRSGEISAPAAGGAYGSPVKLGELEDTTIRESSGIVASRRNPGLFWTHNDSGDGPFLYAFDRRGGRRGVWHVKGARSRDWEDIAVGPGPERGRAYLYIGDIGDNTEKREEIVVYRISEPLITPGDAATSKSAPRQTETPAEAIRLRYPDGQHDAEALLVHPATGDLYIIIKTSASRTTVYKLTAPFSASAIHTLTRVGEVSIPSVLGGMITGGDIGPDGRRVILCDYLGGYELVLPSGDDIDSRSFDTIWRQPVSRVALGGRQQGEAVCYRADGEAILSTSEKRPAPLIEVMRTR